MTVEHRTKTTIHLISEDNCSANSLNQLYICTAGPSSSTTREVQRCCCHLVWVPRRNQMSNKTNEFRFAFLSPKRSDIDEHQSDIDEHLDATTEVHLWRYSDTSKHDQYVARKMERILTKRSCVQV